MNGDWHIYPSFTDAARLWDTVLADGPFISECGARCMPSPETWKKLLSGESFRAVPGDTVYAPEKMARLYPEISHFCMEYPEEMFRRGEKFNRIREIPLAELSEAVNLAAAEFNRIAIEVCRCAWPQNGGLLLWAWKRPWPSVACQLVDGLGQPVQTYYAAKRGYAPLLPCLKLRSLECTPGENLTLRPFLLNEDGKETQNCRVRLRLFSSRLQECFSAEMKPEHPRVAARAHTTSRNRCFRFRKASAAPVSSLSLMRKNRKAHPSATSMFSAAWATETPALSAISSRKHPHTSNFRF